MENYILWKELLVGGEDIGFWKEQYVYFYQAFIENDRWLQYIEGVGTTIVTTACALIIGVILGVLVASVRTAHDQQRRRKSVVLGHAHPMNQVLQQIAISPKIFTICLEQLQTCYHLSKNSKLCSLKPGCCSSFAESLISQSSFGHSMPMALSSQRTPPSEAWS